MVCINLIWCAFSTDSQAAAGQAAGPGSPGGRRLSRKDSGDQARVRAAITSPPFTAFAPCWPIHSLTINLLSATELPVSSLFNRLSFVTIVISWNCQRYSLICSLSRIIKNKEALSEIMQDFKYDSEESDWQVGPQEAHRRPLTSPDSGADRSTRLWCNFHLGLLSCTYRSPLWPHPARCCSLIPPRGLFTFWLCGFLSVVMCLC